jgi:hypothetical protein
VALNFDTLYGAEQPAAAGDATRTARFVVPRGTTPAAPVSVPFVAAAVQVDNAAGSWYVVNGRRVPPWTVSAVVALDPPSAQITVQAVTPAGHLAEAVGEDLVLVVTEARLSPFPGIYVPPAVAFAYRQARAIIRVTEAGAAGTLFVNTVAAAKLVITQVELVAFGSGTAAVRDQVVGNIGWGGAPPPNVVAYMAISPEHPADTPTLDPQAVQLPAGEDITYSLGSTVGGGACDVVLAATYYQAA